MAFNLSKMASCLLDMNRSVYLRAVDLFELQTEIICGDAKARKRARRYAAMKIMEHLENQKGVNQGDIDSALKIPQYRELYLEAMNGGWLSVRRLKSDKKFDQDLKEHLKRAKLAGDVIEFLCSAMVKPTVNRPSLEKAFRCVTGASRTTAKALWNEHRTHAVLLHLILIRKFELAPARVATKGFVAKLMAQANDIQMLTEFFSAYNTVLQKLPSLNVSFGDQLKLDLPPHGLEYGSLQPQQRERLARYYSDTG